LFVRSFPASKTEVITLRTLIVPLALGAGRRGEAIGQSNSPLGWQDRGPSVLVAIDDSQEAAAAPSSGLLDKNERKAG
jgi:hypothetical protein